MTKSTLAILLRRRCLSKTAVFVAAAAVAGVAACGDAPIYTRGPDRGAAGTPGGPGAGEGTGGATGDASPGGASVGAKGIAATGGEPGGAAGGASGPSDPAADAGAGASAGSGDAAGAAGGGLGSEGTAGAGGLGLDGGSGGKGGSDGAGGWFRPGGFGAFGGFGGRAPTGGTKGSGGKGGSNGAGGTLGMAGVGGARDIAPPDGQAGAKGTAGEGGSGGGGGSGGAAGSGGSGRSTDAAKVTFETSSQGWYAAAGGFSNVARRTARAYAGVASLGARLQYAGGAPVTNTLAADSVAPATPPGPGSVVTFHVYLPAGARAIEWVQPFLQDMNLTYASTLTARAALTFGAWNTIKVTVPPNATPTLHVVGIEFRTSGDTVLADDVFIDAIDW